MVIGRPVHELGAVLPLLFSEQDEGHQQRKQEGQSQSYSKPRHCS